MDYTKIKSLEAALKIKGLTIASIRKMFKSMPDEDREAQVISYALDKAEDVINGDEKIDWSDTNQLKYRLWWDIVKKGSSGFGLSLDVCRFDLSHAAVGARRRYASREKALHCAKYFKKHYEQEFFGK